VALAALVALGPLPACGVPSDSGVVVEGRGREGAPIAGDEDTTEPAGRGDTGDPVQFIRNYLAAAAGDPKRASARARQFFAPEARTGWDPGSEVKVIRLHGDPEPAGNAATGGYVVTVTGTVLGVLGGSGMFEPRPPTTRTYRFSITRDTDDRRESLYLTQAEPEILLSDEASRDYFEPRSIYFWSRDHKVLVPDLRYLSRRDVAEAQRPTEIVDWLLAGPPRWLEPAVEALPEAARRVGKVPVSDDGVLRVALSDAVEIDDRAQFNRLAAQLRWSLGNGASSPPLELKVDQVQQRFADDDYREANPAFRGDTERLRFGLVRGQVRQLDAPGAPAPVLPTAANRDVVRAALAVDGDRTRVALLRRVNTGQVALEVGVVTKPEDKLQRTTLPATAPNRVGQPVWLPGSPDTGLVLAGGRLRTFRASGGATPLLANVPKEVTSFAVPPDGRRLAYIARGRLYVAPLIWEGRTVRAGEPDVHLLVPTTTVQLTAVAWSQQTSLAVAGDRSQEDNGIEDITMDGAVGDSPRGSTPGRQPITHLVASTDDPSNGPGAGQVLYVVGDLAYELFTESIQLTAEDVAGADGSRPADFPTYPFYVE
jgi:hypothetical protein